ncbi:uncharacterized protein EV420DRAFT_1563687 [Desarmillaria tabescens]|uniref:Uncharacterized protein n=1 Tax=Armillaria tabescens TaxID=1929756 RepID=A0AA39MXC9_ARMTA|nr:uncharacterized protein EV420DRAFT_1563687 [Desarmillaria tabescens]KAK0449718.1 hypothetical protein EV420DRAFT_1563687 [Desarmillaria tabescens]
MAPEYLPPSHYFAPLKKAVDDAWSKDTFDTFTALDFFLRDLLSTDEARNRFLLGTLSFEEFGNALKGSILPPTCSCEGFVLSVLESAGPSFHLELVQTVPQNGTPVHSFALARHSNDRRPALVDSTMGHLTALAVTPKLFLFKNLGAKPPAFIHSINLPKLPISSPVLKSTASLPSYFFKNALANQEMTTRTATKSDLLLQPFLALKHERCYILCIRYRQGRFNRYGGQVILDLRHRQLTISDKYINLFSTFDLSNSQFGLAQVRKDFKRLAQFNPAAFTRVKQETIVRVARAVAALPLSATIASKPTGC